MSNTIAMADSYTDANASQSFARAAGTWPATYMSFVFVASQLSKWVFQNPVVLLSLAGWIAMGFVIDLWSRHRPVDGRAPLGKSGRLLGWMMFAAALLFGGGIGFRPPTTECASYSWLPLANDVLDRLEFLLPGLRYNRLAMIAERRPDIAAYYGAFQAFMVAGWLVALMLLAIRWNTSSYKAVLTRALMKEVRKAYRPRPSPERYFWRSAHWVGVGFAFILPFLLMCAFWHPASLSKRGFEGIMADPAVYFFPPAFTLLFIPCCVYAGMAWRLAMRVQRDWSDRLEHSHLPHTRRQNQLEARVEAS